MICGGFLKILPI